ncbi:MAG: hypothetical protein HUU56_17970 [Bdellovibrionaceae bacterium]|nr:hypothetical protein [Pseudobdellovibrionaceae bacterium]
MSEIQSAELTEGITLTCVECGQIFSICKSCWRGQKCCSKECSKQLRNKNQRERQRKYQATEKGLEFGRLRQRRRYEKIKLLKSPH